MWERERNWKMYENVYNDLNRSCIIKIPLGCQGQKKWRYSLLISESQGAECSHFPRTIPQPHRIRINLQNLMLNWEKRKHVLVLSELRKKVHVTIIGLNWNYLISSLIGSNWSPRNVGNFPSIWVKHHARKRALMTSHKVTTE